MGITDAKPILVLVTGESLVIRICKNRRKGITIRPDFPTIQRTDQTALKYETAVSDGGRLELKTPQGTAKPVLFAAQESRAARAIPAEASESARTVG